VVPLWQEKCSHHNPHRCWIKGRIEPHMYYVFTNAYTQIVLETPHLQNNQSKNTLDVCLKW
jgi:hypothetical protein